MKTHSKHGTFLIVRIIVVFIEVFGIVAGLDTRNE